jgi:hypothetical protein
VATGQSIAAFAISEAGAGSDLSAMQTTARRDGDAIVIDGEKTWISNAGIAAHYVVFCRWPEGGERSFVALVVERRNGGLAVSGQDRSAGAASPWNTDLYGLPLYRPTRSMASRAKACGWRWARSTYFGRRLAPPRWVCETGAG